MSYRVDILGKAAYTKLMSEYSSVLIFYEMYGQPQMASSHSFKFVRKRKKEMLWKILCQTKQLSYVFYSAFSFSSLVFPVLFSFSRSQLPPKSNDRLEAREKDGRSIFWFLMAF